MASKKDKKSLLAKHEAKPYVPPRVNPEKRDTPSVDLKSMGILRPLQGALLEPCHKSLAPKLPYHTAVGAWKVINTDEQETDFLDCAIRLGNVKTLYHGTRRPTNVESILKEGFRLGSHGMFGAGLYFGMPMKAINYTGYSYTKSVSRFMFQVDVVLGNPLVARDAIPKMNRHSLGEYHSVHGARGYTSSWGGSLNHDEWVVYDTRQVLVTHVFELKEVDNEEALLPKVYRCGNFLHRPKLIGNASAAFRDVLEDNYDQCGTDAPVEAVVKTADGSRKTIHFCKKCAATLRKGMEIRIHKNGPYSKTKWKWGTLI